MLTDKQFLKGYHEAYMSPTGGWQKLWQHPLVSDMHAYSSLPKIAFQLTW